MSQKQGQLRVVLLGSDDSKVKENQGYQGYGKRCGCNTTCATEGKSDVTAWANACRLLETCLASNNDHFSSALDFSTSYQKKYSAAIGSTVMSLWAVLGYGLVAVVAAFAAYIYLFGIPSGVKRDLEEKALEKMGENKASYLVKDAVAKVPDSDEQSIQELKQSLSNAAGGALQNPLGKLAGDTADEATKDLTGR